jgi:hypothetical protein
LPSGEEWDKLYRFADGTNGTESPYRSEIAGKFLKSKKGWNDYEGKSGNGTDNLGFSALAGGYGDSGGNFDKIDSFGYWWSVDESSSDGAYNGGMSYYNESAYRDRNLKDYLFSIRCVQGEAVASTTPAPAEAKAESNESSEAVPAPEAESESECDGVKLLYEIADGSVADDNEDVGTESGNYYYATLFKYDAENRIASIFDTNGDGYGTERILVYGSNDWPTVKNVTYSEMGADTTNVSKMVRNGNTISIGNDSITVNDDGYIIRRGNESYQYRDGHCCPLKIFDMFPN